MGFFTPRITAILGGGAALVALVALFWVLISKNAAIDERDNRITQLEGALHVSQRDLATSQANVTGLQAGLDKQNAAILQMQIDGAARTEAGRRALEEVRQQNLQLQQRADAIGTFQPRDGEDFCAATDRMITESIDAQRRR